jgi:hypothetical protein
VRASNGLARSHGFGVRAVTLALACATFTIGLTMQVSAQSVTDPRSAEFVASSDHWATLPNGAAMVTQYNLEIYIVGSSEPYLVVSLGKPAPGADSKIRVSLIASLPSLPPPLSSYVARVAAIGQTGSGKSDFSNAFSFTGPCASGTVTKLEETLTMACSAASATTGAAGPIHSAGARVTGTVNANGAPTTVTFQYGPTTSYGSASPSLSLLQVNDVESVASLISDVACNTLYHYRIVAANTSITAFGADATFTSAECAVSTSTMIWREKLTGRNAVWLLQGPAIARTAFLPTADPQWTIQATGDVDGDRQPDVVWRDASSGAIVVWILNGTTVANSLWLPAVTDPDWQINGLADFNGDGKADVLWHNTATGENHIWLLDGTGLVGSSAAPNAADLSWQIAAVADFNGDGKADLLWQRNTTGEIGVWLMDGATRAGFGFLPQVTDPTWTIAGVDDLDGDGRADIIWRSSTTGRNFIWFVSGTTMIASVVLQQVFDPNWTIVRLADVDDDGAGDIVWRNHVTGEIGLWLMNGSSIRSATTLAFLSEQTWQLIDQ